MLPTPTPRRRPPSGSRTARAASAQGSAARPWRSRLEPTRGAGRWRAYAAACRLGTMWAVASDFEAVGLLDGVEGERARAARLELLRDARRRGLRHRASCAPVARRTGSCCCRWSARSRARGALYTREEVAEPPGLELDFLERRAPGAGRPAAGAWRAACSREEDVRAGHAAPTALIGRRLRRRGVLEITRVLGQGDERTLPPRWPRSSARRSCVPATPSTTSAAATPRSCAAAARWPGPRSGTCLQPAHARADPAGRSSRQASAQSGRLPGAQPIVGGVRRPHRLHPPRRERAAGRARRRAEALRRSAESDAAQLAGAAGQDDRRRRDARVARPAPRLDAPRPGRVADAEDSGRSSTPAWPPARRSGAAATCTAGREQGRAGSPSSPAAAACVASKEVRDSRRRRRLHRGPFAGRRRFKGLRRDAIELFRVRPAESDRRSRARRAGAASRSPRPAACAQRARPCRSSPR